MSISSIQSSSPQVASLINANTGAASKVSDPAHDGDADDGASAPKQSTPGAGLGTVVDKAA